MDDETFTLSVGLTVGAISSAILIFIAVALGGNLNAAGGGVISGALLSFLWDLRKWKKNGR